MRQLYLHEATKLKVLFLFLNLLRTVSIYSRTIPPEQFLLHLITILREKKMQVCSFLLLRVALDLALCLQKESARREADTARPEFTPQSAAAERPVVNCRRRGKQRGISQSGL